MTEPMPRRPWWQRKRAWAAAVVLLIAFYPLGFGPAVYLEARGWISDAAWAPFYGPLLRLTRDTWAEEVWELWWRPFWLLGVDHAKADRLGKSNSP